ncbi:hypothetical protein [Myroides profundi]|uniref:Uncharacterized protein n=1 Tax=Myroides profundi TaxID=480520 RepID=A0AAJ5BCY2_MYRPR|nr:hypothetical protein [Myroides profundi]AJH14864.1 hypothetical protein MPR_1684 [Myroides profundi]SEQ25604.1 hypothetical protein SAMN04488089_102181 [Myroides profundi]
MRFLLIFLFCTVYSFGQKKKTTITAYQKKTLQEKNIVRIIRDSVGNESYQFLIKPKALKAEIEEYFSPHFSKITSPILTILKHNNLYYFVSKRKDYTLVSLAHLVSIPRVEGEYLIYGSNHCITPNDKTICYPSSDGTSCIERQPSCIKLITKKN